MQKINFKRIATVCTSFCVISIVLVASLVVPVSALTNIFYPKDHILRAVYEDNIESVSFWFDTAPYLSVRDASTGSSTFHYDEAYIDGLKPSNTYQFRVYPLGSGFTPGADITSGVIDLSDFKSGAVFNLSCAFNFELEYAYQGMSSGDTSFYCISYPYLCFYDVYGRYLSQAKISSQRYDITIQDQGPVEDSAYDLVLDLTVPIEIPEGAVYMAPCFITSLYTPDEHASHSIGAATASCRSFIMHADKNLLLAQSETLEAIEDSIGDLNNKADMIINGSEEQMGAALDAGQNTDDLSSDMVSILDRLAELRDNNFTFPMDAIEDFLTSGGWNDIRYLFEPLLNWSPWITIILLVLSFVAISVLLFGR